MNQAKGMLSLILYPVMKSDPGKKILATLDYKKKKKKKKK